MEKVRPTVREIAPGELAGAVNPRSQYPPPGRVDGARALRGEFLELHREWIGRGLTRWLALLSDHREVSVGLGSATANGASGGARPVLMLGAFGTDQALLGAIIAVWHHSPCDRFDDLLETGTAYGVGERPREGAWHLIAVTTSARVRRKGLGLGSQLLGSALAALGATGHRHVRTMSPVIGLPELTEVWGREVGGSLEDAVLHSARLDGRPALSVMRLHLGGGATLERILRDSRRDDRASGGVNLRFCYATDPAARRLQRGRWRRWVAARKGSLRPLSEAFRGAALYRATSRDDRLVWEGPIE